MCSFKHSDNSEEQLQLEFLVSLSTVAISLSLHFTRIITECPCLRERERKKVVFGKKRQT